MTTPPETHSLAGRSAFITGASSGIGAAIAEAFAAAGAEVIAHGLEEDALSGVATRCRAAGAQRVEVLAWNLGADDFDGDALVREVLAVTPAIDVFVSCAGAYFDVPFLEMTAARLDATWRLNVRAGYLVAAALARRWHAAGTQGRMIFIGSINGQLSEAASTAYDTSKAAIEGLVRSLCVELAPLGIRVNGIAPGLVRTPATSWLDREPLRAEWAALHTPSAQVPTADACAGAAVFLAGDAAAHVHGHMLAVDGGLRAVQFPPMPEGWRL